jgi:hypothetical protein
MKRQTSFIVACKDCNQAYGTVREVEDRPGFFHNESDPEEIPKECPVCAQLLSRRPTLN